MINEQPGFTDSRLVLEPVLMDLPWPWSVRQLVDFAGGLGIFAFSIIAVKQPPWVGGTLLAGTTTSVRHSPDGADLLAEHSQKFEFTN